MIEARLKDLDIILPSQPAPAANYVPYVVHNNIVTISGQLPSDNGDLRYLGKVGRDYSTQEAQHAARLCAVNILTQLKAACEGDLNRMARCIRLGGFVNSTDEFTEQPLVINGASDLMVAVFGENGRHARAAVGVNTLPLGVAVEIDAIFALKD